VHTYRELFTVAEFRALFATRCLAIGSGSLASLALGTIMYAETGSTILTALILFGGPLITLLGSATVLGAADSLRPRTALIITAAAAMLAHGLQAVPGLPWPARFVFLAVPYVVTSFTGGIAMKVLARAVGDDGFLLGRSTLNAAVGMFQIVGYASGGLLLVLLSTGQLFLVAAAVNAALVVVVWRGIEDHPASVSSAGLVARTRLVNRQLLGSPVVRPVYLCLWVPNGLVVGCEALFVPLTSYAGYLFAVTAAGMLLGDVVVGRFVAPARRNRLIEPLRLVLAVPWLLLWFAPPLGVVMAVAFVSAMGYSASLPLQDRLLRATGESGRGQAFGLSLNGMMIGHAGGAIIGGVLASVLPVTTAMAILGTASVAVTLVLTPGLRRSAALVPVEIRTT